MRVLIIPVAVLFLHGCAGKVDYSPPVKSYSYQNSKIIGAPKDDVWKRAVSNLSSSFFVINNIDKESGLINVSYSGSPEKYIDCGRFKSYVKNARGERRYSFPASSGYEEYETMTNGNLAFWKRKMGLEGRMNIVIQESSPSETRATVNSRYVLTRDLFVASSDGRRADRNSESVSFNTGDSGVFGLGGTVCLSNGSLEKEVLSKIGE